MLPVLILIWSKLEIHGYVYNLLFCFFCLLVRRSLVRLIVHDPCFFYLPFYSNQQGKGEIEDGEFDDDGPGWDKYPQIKKKLNPVVADDGIFWVTKQEFFDLFQTIYLSASNMTEFLED